jgi:autotransporter passenger strand-loop-strand repeat protein
MTVSSGGTVTGTTVAVGGHMTALAGGETFSGTISGAGATETLSGGTASGATLGNLGKLSVASDGVAIDTTVVGSSGGVFVSDGGTASGTVLKNTGREFVLSGGLDFGITVKAGGLLVVSGGGTTMSSFVSGSDSVSAAELLSASGGPGGTASGTILSGLAVLGVFSGGTALDTIVNSVGVSTSGGLVVRSGGSTVGVTINSGGREAVLQSGTTVDATVNSGGLEFVSSGGTAISSLIFAGGTAIVSGRTATVIDTTVSGGMLIVRSGGLADPTTITAGGTEIVSGGGNDFGASISGGEQDVFGTASGATVFAGSQLVKSGGIASGTVLSSGTMQVVFSKGTARSTSVDGGAQLIVSSGGVAASASISGDSTSGTLVVLRGGTASGTVIVSGGVETVSSGGIDRLTTIGSGGTDLISSGGITSGLLISGGTAEIGVGAVVSGAITFVSSGSTLRFDSTTLPGNTISGLAPGGVVIDLAAVPFDSSSGTVHVASGGTNISLVIGENGSVFSLKLDPTVSYAADQFQLTSDGHGGSEVIVTDPPLGSSASMAIGPQDILYPGGTTRDASLSTLNTKGASQGGHHDDGLSSALAALGSSGFGGDLLFDETTSGGVGAHQHHGKGALHGWPNLGDLSGLLGEHHGKGASEILFRGDKGGDPAFGAISEDGKLHTWHDPGGPSTDYKVLR